MKIVQEGLIERLLVKHIKDEAVIQFIASLLNQANLPKTFSPLMYFTACEVFGTGRTLGDEFAGVHRRDNRTRRVLWIALHTLLLKILGERISGAVGKLHLSIFLLKGDVLHLADRLMRVKREITPAAISAQQSLKFPPWLRYVFAVSLAVQGLADLATLVREKLEAREFENAWTKASAEEESNTAGPDCTICIAKCRRPTAAKCGHVFCWSCAILSFGKEGKCPACRAETTVQELFPLEHYTLTSASDWKVVKSLD
jgi:hypothetical protein